MGSAWVRLSKPRTAGMPRILLWMLAVALIMGLLQDHASRRGSGQAHAQASESSTSDAAIPAPPIITLAQAKPGDPAAKPALVPTPAPAPAPAPAPTPAPTAVPVRPADPAASPVPEGATLPSLQFLFNTSPIINGVIIALSVVTLLLFVYFLLTINIRAMLPPLFLDEVTKLAIARRYDEAADFCRSQQSLFAASILQRAFENVDKDPSHLLTVIEAEGKRRADLVWTRVSYLMEMSSLAPMLGLLGTVLGMLEAFFGLNASPAGGGVGSKVLASSIGGAMTATFLGLTVAVLATVFHSIIKSRAVATLAEVELIVHSIADHVHRPDRPSGTAGGGA